MIITPIDECNNLFQVRDLVPDSLLARIQSTNWLSLPHNKIDKQEWMVRENIPGELLPWNEQWNLVIKSLCRKIKKTAGIVLQPAHNTSWWIDQPGFQCAIHSDDPRVNIALQMFWIGSENLGTVFYEDLNVNNVRKQFEFVPNTGYLIINNSTQYHDMMSSIPEGTFRLTSYTWLYQEGVSLHN